MDELPEIPSFDLPAGTPTWMREGVDWARMAEDPGPQRANVTIQVPAL